MAQLMFTEDRETFERMLLVGDPKRPHTARMAGRAQKFIGGMSDKTRDAFLEAALDFAWTHRLTYNPQYEALRNAGKEKFSALIVRVDDAIMVRVPLAPR